MINNPWWCFGMMLIVAGFSLVMIYETNFSAFWIPFIVALVGAIITFFVNIREIEK